jgi:hypothetical protein
MANWFHRFLNPHCSHCAEERKEKAVCKSCEILQFENDRLHAENSRLLTELLKNDNEQPLAVRDNQDIPKIPLPRRMPFTARRQMLEAEDRERAKILRQAPKPETASVEDFAKELADVEKERATRSSQ